MEETLKFAVFIDYDNIEIGVRTTLGRDLDIAIILEGIKQRGEIVAKFSYGNWGHHLEATRAFSEFGVQMVQRDSTPRGDKNGADINLALDAFEMAVTRDHINAFAIVSGDSDFMSLVNKLKQYNKRVYIVGGKQFTSKILQRNCHEFISYESLLDILPSRARRGRGSRSSSQAARSDPQQPAQIMPLVDRALNALDVRGAQPQLGLLKSTMLQLDPAFSEKDYGVSSFSSLAEKLVDESYIKVVTVDNHHVVERLDKAVAAADQETPAESEPSNGSPRRGRGRGRGRGGRGRAAAGRPAAESTEAASPPASEGEPQQEEESPPANPRAQLQQLLAPHADLLEIGIPAKEVEALIRADKGRFSAKKLGFADFTALLDFAEAEELLRSIPDDRNILRYKPGDALSDVAVETSAAAEEEQAQSAPKRRRRSNAAPRRSPDRDGAPEETEEQAAGDDSKPAPKKVARKKSVKRTAKKKAAKKKVARKTAKPEVAESPED